MSVKEVKLICEYQGISYKPEQMAWCPKCRTKTAKIDIKGKQVQCIRCKKEWSLSEFLRLCEEDWLDKHRGTFYTQREKKGVNL